MLRITEIFRSIQGESTHACDSEYTRPGGEHVSVEDVMRQVRAYGCQLVAQSGLKNVRMRLQLHKDIRGTEVHGV